MKRAAIYARYSSHNQQEISIEAQIANIREYADENGYQIIEVYTDKALSGFEKDRPGFNRMIEDVKKNKFDAILVWEYARFARDREIARKYKNILQKHNVELISINEHIPNSPEGVIIESLYEGMAEYYSRKLARDTVRGMIQTVKDGYTHGGYPPFGYKYITVNGKHKLVVDEKEKPIVQTIFEMAAKGATLSQLARWLNNQGIKTRRGNDFTVDAVRNILKNPKYIGKIIFNNRRNRGKFNPFKEPVIINNPELAIVDISTFQKVSAVLRKNRKRQAKRVYLLRGLVYCGVCGSPLIGGSRGAKNGARYQCANCKRQGHYFSIGADKLEEFVLKVLEPFLYDIDYELLTNIINDKIKRNLNLEELKTLEEREEEVQRSIQNITRAIEQGFVAQTLLDKLIELENKQNKLEHRIREILIQQRSARYYTVEEIKQLVQKTQMLFKKMFSMQRQLIIEVIQEIIVDFQLKQISITTLFGSYKATFDNRGIYLIRTP